MARATNPLMTRKGLHDAELAYRYRRTVGLRLAELREAAGMTQRDLSKLLDCGETAISALENGRNSLAPERYEQIATIFKLDRKEWGRFLLRYTDPRLYVLLFGVDSQRLVDDLHAYAGGDYTPSPPSLGSYP